MPNFSGIWNLKEQVQAVAAGRWTGLPIFELYGWGRNLFGGIGDGTIVSRSSPVQVAGSDWAQVSAGFWLTASIKTDGTLWAWGYQGSGGGGPISGIGDGTIISRSSPTQIGALTNWAQVSAGGGRTASVKTDGTLWAWGVNSNRFNRRGALGDGTTIDRSSPVQIGALTNWAQVSAGQGHTACVKTDGTLWTWGFGGYGTLGHNNNANLSSPVQVGALTNWAQVSAGVNHTAAITTSGTLYAWGWGYGGNLGQGTVISRSSPVQVGALTNWKQASAGRRHIAAVKTDGTFWAWGYGGNGELGQGTVISHSSPVQVGALTKWAQAAAGGLHTAALFQDTTN